jgi:hypothetical protein
VSERVIDVYRHIEKFSAMPGREQAIFKEMMIISSLCYTNTLN